jgi:hypothetical protein
MSKKPVKPPPPRNQKVKRVAFALFAINVLICGFFVFEPNMNCSYKVDLTSRLQVAWREAHCPETLEEAEKPANISP